MPHKADGDTHMERNKALESLYALSRKNAADVTDPETVYHARVLLNLIEDMVSGIRFQDGSIRSSATTAADRINTMMHELQ